MVRRDFGFALLLVGFLVLRFFVPVSFLVFVRFFLTAIFRFSFVMPSRLAETTAKSVPLNRLANAVIKPQPSNVILTYFPRNTKPIDPFAKKTHNIPKNNGIIPPSPPIASLIIPLHSFSNNSGILELAMRAKR